MLEVLVDSSKPLLIDMLQARGRASGLPCLRDSSTFSQEHFWHRVCRFLSLWSLVGHLTSNSLLSYYLPITTIIWTIRVKPNKLRVLSLRYAPRPSAGDETQSLGTCWSTLELLSSLPPFLGMSCILANCTMGAISCRVSDTNHMSRLLILQTNVRVRHSHDFLLNFWFLHNGL